MLDAELDRLDEVSFEVLTTLERLRSLERLECLAPGYRRSGTR